MGDSGRTGQSSQDTWLHTGPGATALGCHSLWDSAGLCKEATINRFGLGRLTSKKSPPDNRYGQSILNMDFRPQVWRNHEV